MCRWCRMRRGMRHDLSLLRLYGLRCRRRRRGNHRCNDEHTRRRTFMRKLSYLVAGLALACCTLVQAEEGAVIVVQEGANPVVVGGNPGGVVIQLGGGG